MKMKKITSKKELIESLKDARAVELAARNMYLKDIKSFSDLRIKNTFKAIINDETIHISLLDELLEMLKKT